MSNISQETAGEIWNCYREILAGEKMLKEITEKIKEEKDNKVDFFSASPEKVIRGHDLHAPNQNSASSTLFSIDPELAMSVIRAHIAQKKAQLGRGNEQARMELGVGIRDDVELVRAILKKRHVIRLKREGEVVVFLEDCKVKPYMWCGECKVKHVFSKNGRELGLLLEWWQGDEISSSQFFSVPNVFVHEE